jgi:hypothetical protein
MLSLGVIEQAQDIGYFSQVLLTPKPNGKWRFCINYRKLNTVSLLNAGHPLPNIPETLQRLGSRKFIWAAKMDLTSGYHQVEMDPETRHFAAFITSFGVFVPTRLMFGMKCAPWSRSPFIDGSMPTIGVFRRRELELRNLRRFRLNCPTEDMPEPSV